MSFAGWAERDPRPVGIMLHSVDSVAAVFADRRLESLAVEARVVAAEVRAVGAPGSEQGAGIAGELRMRR